MNEITVYDFINEFKDIDVNILIPYDKLESRNMIKLVLDHVDYSKNDNVLIMKIR